MGKTTVSVDLGSWCISKCYHLCSQKGVQREG